MVFKPIALIDSILIFVRRMASIKVDKESAILERSREVFKSTWAKYHLVIDDPGILLEVKNSLWLLAYSQAFKSLISGTSGDVGAGAGAGGRCQRQKHHVQYTRTHLLLVIPLRQDTSQIVLH